MTRSADSITIVELADPHRGPSIADRFPTAATSAPPTADQREVVAALQYRVLDLAKLIDTLVPEGRDKSIALTSLEDVLMRANRGVFTAAR